MRAKTLQLVQLNNDTQGKIAKPFHQIQAERDVLGFNINRIELSRQFLNLLNSLK